MQSFFKNSIKILFLKGLNHFEKFGKWVYFFVIQLGKKDMKVHS